MSAGYVAVGWSPGKRRYDALVAGCCALYLATFAVASLVLRPEITAETLLLRAFGTLALLLLHVVLAIGPLARLDRRFLPLLWNRRHLGVVTFLAGLAHGGLAIVQFHALGDRSPLVSVLTSNRRFGSVADFPFQQLGLAALVILFLMAATSHDFWLANLSAPVWKRLHFGAYLAYALLVGHVALGALQDERALAPAALLAAGVACLVTLHLAAGLRGRALDRELGAAAAQGFVAACRADEIPEKRAKIVTLAGERVAIFRYDGKISAVSNVCQHQNGPLGEGRILDGCITCPWHGFQYLPSTGASPPPFHERVPTFRVQVVAGSVLVDPRPLPPGTFVEPASCTADAAASHPAAVLRDDGGEFFVGYLPVPAGIGRFLRRVALGAPLGGAFVAAVLASAQAPLGAGHYAWSESERCGGIVAAAPVAGLWSAGAGESWRFLPLVGTGKQGVADDVLAATGRAVELLGKRIERHGLTMLEVGDAPVPATPSRAGAPPVPERLGRFRLRGEIVDSKCYLGVMKPGSGKAHRDCAVRCISGGAPAMLRVLDPEGRVLLLFLAATDGRPLGRELLDRVAEPVEAAGEVSRVGDWLVMLLEPSAVQRVAPR